MTIAPLDDDLEVARRAFVGSASCVINLRAIFGRSPELSMGMTGDLEQRDRSWIDADPRGKRALRARQY